jgi:hypothetical protein
MKTITFPKEMYKILKSQLIPTTKIGYYKPHQIYHVLDYKKRPTHTYIQITKITLIPVSKLPKTLEFKKLQLTAKVELLKFKIVYEDEYTELDGYGNVIPKVFNFIS